MAVIRDVMPAFELFGAIGFLWALIVFMRWLLFERRRVDVISPLPFTDSRAAARDEGLHRIDDDHRPASRLESPSNKSTR